MNYTRRKNDSQIHILLEDMKKMNAVVTRLQREITDLRMEVQALRQSVHHPPHSSEVQDRSRPMSDYPGPESSRPRGAGKFEKQRELLVEQAGESEAPTSNPWDDRRATRCHHTVNHF